MTKMTIKKAFGELRSLASKEDPQEQNEGLAWVLGELAFSESWQTLEAQLIPYLLSHDTWKPRAHHPVYDSLLHRGRHPYASLRRSLEVKKTLPDHDPYLKHITHLSVRGLIAQEITAETWSQHYPNLKALSLEGVTLEHLPLPPKLESLTLQDVLLWQDVTSAPELKKLTLRDVTFYRGWPTNLLKGNLVELGLTRCEFTAHTPEWDCTLPCLEKLQVRESNLRPGNFFDQNWTALRELTLMSDSWLMRMSMTLRDVQLHLPALETLKLKEGFLNHDPFCTALRSGIRFRQQLVTLLGPDLQILEVNSE